MKGLNIKKSKFTSFVKALRIEPGTLLLFKQGVATEASINEIAGIIGEMRIPNVVIMVVDDPTNVTTMPVAEMEKHGWFRADALTKLIHRGKPDASKEAPADSGDESQPA